jgi:hypothetical protein
LGKVRLFQNKIGTRVKEGFHSNAALAGKWVTLVVNVSRRLNEPRVNPVVISVPEGAR